MRIKCPGNDEVAGTLDGDREMTDSISRAELESRLKKLTWVRRTTSFVTFVVSFVCLWRFFPDNPRGDALIAAALAAVIFALMTWLYCRPGVRCPFCGGSLWNCGMPSFKARYKRLWTGVTACPHCDLPIQ